jgi:3-oxoadipate enol-lactonase
MSAIAEMFLANWFPPGLLEAGDGRGGLIGCFAAIRDADLRRPIRLISCPTLVIVGENERSLCPSTAS